MKLRLVVAFLILTVLVVADTLLAVWAINAARMELPDGLVPLGIAIVATVALGLGGVVITVGQTLLSAWISSSLPRHKEVF